MKAVKYDGLPSRLRSGKGRENVLVADYMLEKRGTSRVITGSSTHNQRLGRVWKDAFSGVLPYFYHIFYFGRWSYSRSVKRFTLICLTLSLSASD